VARQRDHKAEYQRQKQRATKSGYKSVRQYKRVKSELVKEGKLPSRNVSLIPERIYRSGTNIKRRQASNWSKKHSHVRNSRYQKNFTNSQVEAYWQAFVRPPGEGETRLDRKFRSEKRRRVYDYLVGQGIISEQQWRDGNY